MENLPAGRPTTHARRSDVDRELAAIETSGARAAVARTWRELALRSQGDDSWQVPAADGHLALRSPDGGPRAEHPANKLLLHSRGHVITHTASAPAALRIDVDSPQALSLAVWWFPPPGEESGPHARVVRSVLATLRRELESWEVIRRELEAVT